MAYYVVSDENLKSVADHIREKGGTSELLSFPDEFILAIDEIETGGVPAYTGSYEVTPNFSEQTLSTQNKRMRDDVTVHQIPVVRTSNLYGGDTVVIG